MASVTGEHTYMYTKIFPPPTQAFFPILAEQVGWLLRPPLREFPEDLPQRDVRTDQVGRMCFDDLHWHLLSFHPYPPPI